MAVGVVVFFERAAHIIFTENYQQPLRSKRHPRRVKCCGADWAASILNAPDGLPAFHPSKSRQKCILAIGVSREEIQQRTPLASAVKTRRRWVSASTVLGAAERVPGATAKQKAMFSSDAIDRCCARLKYVSRLRIRPVSSTPT